MATLNAMLIPGNESVIEHGERWHYGVIIDQDGNTVWKSPVMYADRYPAWIKAREDAEAAIDVLCYERRHQLQLL